MVKMVEVKQPYRAKNDCMPRGSLPEACLNREIGTGKRSMASLLFRAVVTCLFSRVRFLLNNGVSVNVVSDLGYNLLIAALFIKDEDKRNKMFRYLVKRGADCCYCDEKTGRDVLIWASMLGRTSQVYHLLRAAMGELDFTKTDNQGLTALHHATIQGHIEIVRLLVEEMTKYRLSVDVTDSQGMTPYIHANRLGFYDIAEVLLHKGHCSRDQFDDVLHRSVDDWIKIGLQERMKSIREQHRRILREYKIMGRIPTLMLKKRSNAPKTRFQLPAIAESGNGGTTDELFYNNKAIGRTSAAHFDIGDYIRLSEGDQQIRNNLTLPVLTSEGYLSSGRLFENQTGKSLEAAFALLGIKAKEDPDVGQVAQFEQNGATEVGKSEQTSGVVGNITSMMDALSQQQTDSFRVVAKPVTPLPPVKPPAVPQEKKKISTLAILFGRNTGTKRKGRTNANKKPGTKAKKRKGTGNKTK